MAGEPPPMPHRGPAAPPSLPYASRASTAGGSLAVAARAFNFRMFLWSMSLVILWTLILVFVVPRLAEVFMDFRIELPFVTKVLLSLSKVVAYGGFLVLLLIPFALGFISGPLDPGGRRVLRMLVTLAFGLVVGITVLAVAVPLVTLMNGMTGGGNR